jgi:signal peptidase II
MREGAWRLWRWLVLAAVLIGLDQGSKQAVLAHFLPGETRALSSFFNLVLVYNPGAAFSFLAGAGGWQKWFFALLALVVAGWIVGMLHRHPDARSQNLALTLILSGALGNLIDRLAYGAVVDFLDFHLAGWHWPAFNLADSCITLGAVSLVLRQLLAERQESRGASQTGH